MEKEKKEEHSYSKTKTAKQLNIRVLFFLTILCLRPKYNAPPSYKDHVTNKEVRAKIQQAYGLHEDLTIVKRRKLQWHGHVSCSSGLAKIILQGIVKGGRRQGKGRGGKTTSGNGQAWSSPSPRRQRRIGGNGGNCLRNHF